MLHTLFLFVPIIPWGILTPFCKWTSRSWEIVLVAPQITCPAWFHHRIQMQVSKFWVLNHQPCYLPSWISPNLRECPAWGDISAFKCAMSVKSYLTLCDPILWTVACQAPLSMGFSRQEYCSGLPHPPPGYLPDPGMETASLASPALAGRFFITSATWEAQGH